MSAESRRAKSDRRLAVTALSLAARVSAAAALLVTVVSVACVLGWAVITLAARPTVPGETEVLFEASRIRAHLPLHRDPAVGAYDYGSLPARYMVTYPPLWAPWVALLPSGEAALLFDRIACLSAWLGAFALLVATARRGCRGHALALAAFYVGTFNLALFAASGRPDSIAVIIAAVALVRSVRGGRLDALSAMGPGNRAQRGHLLRRAHWSHAPSARDSQGPRREVRAVGIDRRLDAAPRAARSFAVFVGAHARPVVERDRPRRVDARAAVTSAATIATTAPRLPGVRPASPQAQPAACGCEGG